MKIQVNYADMSRTEAIDGHVQDKVNQAMTRFEDRVTRVEVHLHDENGQAGASGGPDKRCVMEARIAGHAPLVAEHAHGDLYLAIADCAGKLHRAVEHWIERHK